MKRQFLEEPVSFDVCLDNQLDSLRCTCWDLHFSHQFLHFRIIFFLDAVVIVKDFHPADMIAELEPVTVECELFLASGDVGNDMVQVNRRLVKCASFARNAWGMFCSVAWVSVIIDCGLDVPWLDAWCWW